MTTAVCDKAKKLKAPEDVLKIFARAAVEIYLPPRDRYGNPNLGRFIIDNGRLPFITDDPKPWAYRGWLIPYLQMCESHPSVAPRYDYVLRTLDAGRLLDEPLPQIEFCGESGPAVQPGLRMLKKCLERVEYRLGLSSALREFCQWLGFALGVETEASKLEEPVQEFLYRNFSLEPLVLAPADYLGQLLTESGHGKRSGFFPTPTPVCEAMVRMVAGDAKGDRRAVKVVDPCVGTGRMLLVASNYSMRLFGQDIDPLCCLITKINLALYAPWFYVPEAFFESEAEKTGYPLSEGENGPQRAETRKSEADQEKSETLFDRLLTEKRRIEAGRAGKKKIYTTDVEQPTLF